MNLPSLREDQQVGLHHRLEAPLESPVGVSGSQALRDHNAHMKPLHDGEHHGNGAIITALNKQKGEKRDS
jgi:hypothetical protein